jgi:hypothetical protein
MTSAKLAVEGNVAIGNGSFAGAAAPSDGLLVGGQVRIGTSLTTSAKLAVSGNVAIGSSYATSLSPPSDGLLVQGNVVIGTTNTPSGVLHVNASATPNIYLEQGGGSSLIVGFNMVTVFEVAADGRVGIGGASSLTSKLKFNGSYNSQLNPPVIPSVGGTCSGGQSVNALFVTVDGTVVYCDDSMSKWAVV